MADPSADAIIGIYTRHAAAFDQQRSRRLIEQHWLDRFLSQLPPSPDILDLGCGMGEPIARHLLERGADITGVDTSAPLLALARDRFPKSTWIEADMRGFDLGRAFDGLIAWHSFFHLTQDAQRAMFPVFANHLRPGGVLLFTSGPEAGEAVGQFEGEPLHHASLSPAEYRELLSKTGFSVIQHVSEPPDTGGATVWLARRVPFQAFARLQPGTQSEHQPSEK